MFKAPIIHIEEIDSTSSHLKSLSADSLSDGCTVYADFQTSGRGQRGNSWESEPKKNLTFSTILFPQNIKAEDQFLISQITSLAIKDVLSRYTDNITIKWPNDIYWEDRKITGILIENSIMGEYISQSVLGIGINLNQTKFESNAPNPVSLKQITNTDYQIRTILTEVLCQLFYYYQWLLNSNKIKEIRNLYKKSLYRKEGFYKFTDKDGTFSARIKDVEDIGLLVLETESGDIKRYGFKEIKYIFN